MTENTQTQTDTTNPTPTAAPAPETAAAPAPAPAGPTLEEQLASAKKEAAHHQERYLRAVADLENYRKRMLREKDELRQYAAANVVEEAVWATITSDLSAEVHGYALGLVSTILGAVKDRLACAYVATVSSEPVRTLNLDYLFSGSDTAAGSA